MGSMGKHKGRRTRSVEGGKRVNIDGGVGFPVFQYGAFTPRGTYERFAAIGRSARWARDHPEQVQARKRTRTTQLGTIVYVGVWALTLGVFVAAWITFLIPWILRQFS